MKWWNKKRGRDNWTKIQVPMSAWTRASITHSVNLVTWCKQQPSEGRFYHYFDKWYFEKPEDATFFVMKWL